jgi:hypothetical protein
MKACLKCTSKQDYICLGCGGCPECCKCTQSRQMEDWVHVSSKEGALKRNSVIRASLPPAKV